MTCVNNAKSPTHGLSESFRAIIFSLSGRSFVGGSRKRRIRRYREVICYANVRLFRFVRVFGRSLVNAFGFQFFDTFGELRSVEILKSSRLSERVVSLLGTELWSRARSF